VWNAKTGTFIRSFGSQLSFADGITFGPDNLLYVSDVSTNQIKRFDPNTGAYLGVFGTANSPGDLGFGPDGMLYVSSFGDHNIIKLNGATGAYAGVVVPAFGPAYWPEGFAFYPVPEPATLSLFAGAAVLFRRRVG
jgi:streptogramin lyase